MTWKGEENETFLWKTSSAEGCNILQSEVGKKDSYNKYSLIKVTRDVLV
jgi:hypothetical protein